MSSALRVYVDYDDVLCETARMLVTIAAREFGCRLRFDRIVSFDIGKSFSISPSQVERVMEVAHAEETLLAMQPVPGAREAIAAWKQSGHHIEIVTGRPPATVAASNQWLRRQGVPHDGLVFVDKYERGYADHPGVVCLAPADLRSRRYDLCIDDSRPMIDFMAGTLGVRSILFDRPWNAAGPDCAGTSALVTRCRGWARVLDVFSGCATCY